MWYILKSKNKSLNFLKKNLKDKFGSSLKIYTPKIEIDYFKKNKLQKKTIYLLSNYLLCFHEKFRYIEILKSIKYIKGLDQILESSKDNQQDITNFILNCKKHEDQNGNVKSDFSDFTIGQEYKLLNGPLSSFLIKLTKINKNKFEALVGSTKIVVTKNNHFFGTI